MLCVFFVWIELHVSIFGHMFLNLLLGLKNGKGLKLYIFLLNSHMDSLNVYNESKPCQNGGSKSMTVDKTENEHQYLAVITAK